MKSVENRGWTYVAIDLGAESGRVGKASFDGSRMALEQIHRFKNDPVRLGDSLHWDILHLFHEIKDGLRRLVANGRRVESIGVDAWGVDFGLLGRDGSLLGNPYHYRDARTSEMTSIASKRASKTEIYWSTGVQFLPFNTLYQLLAMEDSPLLEVADVMLLIPDLLNYWLTGSQASEYTNATTTQLYSATAGDWAWPIIERLNLPPRIFPAVLPPGECVGGLRASIVEETRMQSKVEVVRVASHDTASAVVAVPAHENHFAFISSGSWSLVGQELDRPVLTEAALRANFSNEGGFGGKTLFLRNVMGLWLLQECQRTWRELEGRNYSYQDLMQLAQTAPAFGPMVDPDASSFLPPGDMPARLRLFCRDTAQKVPENHGELIRCILESLALKYRWVIESLQAVSGVPVRTIHIIGGGANNELLCHLTAEATRRPVIAGPAEATALGNALVQANAHGHVNSLQQMRQVVGVSFQPRVYEPTMLPDVWDDAYDRFLAILAGPRTGQATGRSI